MHVIVRQGDGKYYVSAAFAFYGGQTDDDYREQYWVVWDERRERLIRWLNWVPDTQYIIPQILIVDGDEHGWVKCGQGFECVDFLSAVPLDALLDADLQPEEVLEKCRGMDSVYVYDETPEIKTPADIHNLECASGMFHDARIAREELREDGTLYLRFEGTWGCEIEVWLWGDLEYDTSSRNPEEYDPYWQCATIIQENGFIYFIDEEDATVAQINPNNCYFKARHMKYRIIPD